MKILFLDIDGVVNCETTTELFTGLWPLDRYMAFLVGKIVLDTGCKVVLSSSWKHHPEGKAVVEKHICKVFDITPDCAGKRGNEIDAWLDKWAAGVFANVFYSNPDERSFTVNAPDKNGFYNVPVEKYAILDDDSDFYPEQKLFKTSWKTGLTEEIAKEITKYLNE